MAFRIVTSLILVAAGTGLFVTAPGRMVPPGVRVLPFIELALLWLHVARGRPGWLATTFLVQFWVVFAVIIVPAAVGTWTFAYLDREHRSAPVVLGDRAAAKELVVVYHPGASGLLDKALRRAGECLGDAGYKVTLYTAHSGLRPDLSHAAAIGLASPVYGDTVRPPLQRYIAQADLSGRDCFVFLSGTVPLGQGKDMQLLAPMVEARGGRIVAAGKVLDSKEPGGIDRQVDAFCSQLVAALDGR